jgi:hypothetical protein
MTEAIGGSRGSGLMNGGGPSSRLSPQAGNGNRSDARDLGRGRLDRNSPGRRGKHNAIALLLHSDRYASMNRWRVPFDRRFMRRPEAPLRFFSIVSVIFASPSAPSSFLAVEGKNGLHTVLKTSGACRSIQSPSGHLCAVALGNGQHGALQTARDAAERADCCSQSGGA